jgi:hypothetical protein
MAWRALAFSASGTLSSMSGTSTSTAHRGEGRELSSSTHCVTWPSGHDGGYQEGPCRLSSGALSGACPVFRAQTANCEALGGEGG